MQRVEALEADHTRVRENVSQQFEARVTELELRIEQLKAERDAELEQVHARYFKKKRFTTSKIITFF